MAKVWKRELTLQMVAVDDAPMRYLLGELVEIFARERRDSALARDTFFVSQLRHLGRIVTRVCGPQLGPRRDFFILKRSPDQCYAALKNLGGPGRFDLSQPH